MVSVKPEPYIHSNGRNDYWKLELYNGLSVKEMESMLAERKYHPGSSKSKSTLRCCLRRTDLGLLSYVNYTNDELRILIKNRGIGNYSGGHKGSREELIRVLEHGDCYPKFENFTRLPTELRARVYDYYFSEFSEEPLHAPKQPPLTLTSSLVRRESLPLFYASCVFELRLRVPMDVKVPQLPKDLVIPKETLMWLHSTRAENLADIQHIGVKVLQNFNGYNQGSEAVTFSIGNPTIKNKPGLRILHSSWNSMDRTVLKQAISGITREMRSRNKGWKVEKEDFFKLRKAIEVSLP